jgi:hypothetical protein
MSLHDLFSNAVNYPITLQDVGNVVGFGGAGVALLLVLSFAAAFAWAILTSIGAELSGEASKRRRAERERQAKRAAKAERDRIAQQEWLSKQNQRKIDREELNALRAKRIASWRVVRCVAAPPDPSWRRGGLTASG